MSELEYEKQKPMGLLFAGTKNLSIRIKESDLSSSPADEVFPLRILYLETSTSS